MMSVTGTVSSRGDRLAGERVASCAEKRCELSLRKRPTVAAKLREKVSHHALISCPAVKPPTEITRRVGLVDKLDELGELGLKLSSNPSKDLVAEELLNEGVELFIVVGNERLFRHLLHDFSEAI